jgi:hypothetical protein
MGPLSCLFIVSLLVSVGPIAGAGPRGAFRLPLTRVQPIFIDELEKSMNSETNFEVDSSQMEFGSPKPNSFRSIHNYDNVLTLPHTLIFLLKPSNGTESRSPRILPSFF